MLLSAFVVSVVVGSHCSCSVLHCYAANRQHFFKSEVLLTLAWLLDHANRKIQVEARRFMEGLRTCGGTAADPFVLTADADGKGAVHRNNVLVAFYG